MKLKAAVSLKGRILTDIFTVELVADIEILLRTPRLNLDVHVINKKEESASRTRRINSWPSQRSQPNF